MPRLEINSFDSTEHSAPSLYRKRVFEYVDQIAVQIEKLAAGKAEKIELLEKEREDLLCFENLLGEKLEKINDIPNPVFTLYLDYFATPEGRNFLKEVSGLELETADLKKIGEFIHKNTGTLRKIGEKARRSLSEKANPFADKRLLKKLLSGRDANGRLNISRDVIPVPERFQMLVNPERSVEKISALRSFKNEVREQLKILGNKEDLSEMEKAQAEIFRMFQRRVNLMLANQYFNGVITHKRRDLLGDEMLSADEKEVLSLFSGLSSPDRNRSRLDKFSHGASADFEKSGNHIQVPESLKQYAEKIAKEEGELELHKDELIENIGLDPEYLLREDISPQQRARLGEEFLASQNLKSAYAADTYDPDRITPARDGKWQYFLEPGRSSMEVKSQKGVILDSAEEKRSIVTAISVSCGHEMVHVLQNENRKLIPFRMIKRVGGSRSDAFSEGGAMHVQDKICQDFFGFKAPPYPHYIRAMLKKLEGGNYIDCVNAFYESSLISLRKKLKEKKLDQASFDQKAESKLKTAINRTKRLFSDGINFNSKSPFLTHSKDTVYLEQIILLEKLKNIGLEKLAFIGGVGLDDLISFIKLGYLKLSQIREYDFASLKKIWEREKPKYLLEEKT